MDYLHCTKSRVARKEDLEEGEDVEMKVLVAKDSKSKTIFAHAVVAKGSDEDGYAVCPGSSETSRDWATLELS